MKRIKTTLAGTALVLAASTAAHAVPVLTLTNGSSTVVVTGTESSDPAIPSYVSYNGSIGNFMINVTTGISILGTSYIDLNSVDVSNSINSPTTLDIKFSDTGFTYLNPIGFNKQIGGVIDGILTFNAYYDPGNLLNAETVEIGSTLSNPQNGAFSASDVGPVSATGPFSLTEEITLTHSPGVHTSSFDAEVTPVPEPASVMLLGAGLAGIWICGKRRKNN